MAFGSKFGFTFNSGITFGGAASRYFSTLDGTADYFTIPTVSLTADFEIEADFSTTDTVASFKMIFGGSTNENYLAINGDGDIQINIAGNGANISSATTEDGKLHRIKVTRVGTLVTLYLDNISIGNYTDSGTWVLDEIGSWNNAGGFFFNGVLANILITSAGTLIRDYKVDETWDGSTALIDYGTDASNGTAVSITTSNAEQFTLLSGDYIGAELVTNGGFDTDTDWTKGTSWTIGSGVASSDGSVNFDRIRQSTSFVGGARYIIPFEVSNYISGDVKIEIRGGTIVYGTARASNGSYTDILTSTTGSNEFNLGCSASGFTGSVDNVSVKRILEAP